MKSVRRKACNSGHALRVSGGQSLRTKHIQVLRVSDAQNLETKTSNAQTETLSLKFWNRCDHELTSSSYCIPSVKYCSHCIHGLIIVGRYARCAHFARKGIQYELAMAVQLGSSFQLGNSKQLQSGDSRLIRFLEGQTFLCLPIS